MKRPILFLFLLSFLLLEVSARLGNADEPRRRRFLAELSGHVHRELQSMAYGSSFASGNFGGSAFSPALEMPKAAQRIHKILTDGTAGNLEDDAESREMAITALHTGAAALLVHDHGMAKEDVRRYLPKHQLTDDMFSYYNSTTGMHNRFLQVESAYSKLFIALLVLIIAFAITNVIAGVTGLDIPLATNKPYLKGDIYGYDYDTITPCNAIPLAPNEKFGYFPVLNGLWEDIDPGIDAVFAWFEKIFNVEENLKADYTVDSSNCFDTGETCSFSSECCNNDTEKFLVACDSDTLQCKSEDKGAAPAEFIFEPFCMLWSEDPDNFGIDTIGFRPLSPWPPVTIAPGISLLPSCLTAPCGFCDLALGFPMKKITLGKVNMMLTSKFGGFAASWANGGGKLALKPNDNVEIWDGFRNIPLPEITGINFWMNFELRAYDLGWWTYVTKTVCPASPDTSYLEAALNVKRGLLPYLGISFDLFVKVTSDSDEDELASNVGGGLGNSDTSTVAESGRRLDNIRNEFGSNTTWDESTSGRRLDDSWRELATSDGPCVIMTANAVFAYPLLGTSLSFGDIVGGYCRFLPEETGARCTPSGFFLNINQEFQIEGAVGGIIATFAEGFMTEQGIQPTKSGNSLGFFQDLDGELEAVVFRYEAPVMSLFGVQIAGGGPVIHFQWAKGSEIERRRESILRRRSCPSGTTCTQESDWGPWVVNCDNVEVLSDCNNNDDSLWAEFGPQTSSSQTQICKKILINPDDNPDYLLYYNRVLTAELKDPAKLSDNYVITPPDNSKFQAPAKYDFSNNPDANVFIMYLAIANFGNSILMAKEISATLILSDSSKEPSISTDELEEALSAYSALSDDAKAIWREPSGFYFPSLAEYLDHLPSDPDEPTEAEISAAEVWNENVDTAVSNFLGVYIRLFCKIEVLFFADIAVGFIMENFVEDEPTKWAIAAQFEAELVGMLYTVAAAGTIDFDRRRHLHLEEEEEYHRALATTGLAGVAWDTSFSARCLACEAFVEFFEDAGEFIMKGVSFVGNLFTEDIAGFANKAINAIGDWGESFVQSIEDFANGVKDLFGNNEYAQLVTPERLEAFGERAVDIITFGSPLTLDDLVEFGKLLLGGASLAAEAFITGVIDVANAIGDFFDEGFTTIARCLDTSKKWREYRSDPYYRNLNQCLAQCRANRELGEAQTKKNCWCTDEFECKVKVPQSRTCKKCWKGIKCKTCCGDWTDVPIESGGGFPRYDGRKFDAACREERMAKVALVQEAHDKMKKTGQLVDSNFKNKFNGLVNFSPSNLRRRRLQGSSVTNVNSVAFDNIVASSGGVLLDGVAANGQYDGSQLKPDSTSTNSVNKGFSTSLDFSMYANPGRRDLQGVAGDATLNQFRRGAAGVFMEAQDFSDADFFSRQPIVPAPAIELAAGAEGSQNNPLELDCDGSLASAWETKLDSAEPEVLRRRRTRELSSHGSQDWLGTVVEIAAEARIKQMILTGEIEITISVGNVADDAQDGFADARRLLGTDGVFSFMDPSNTVRRRKLLATDYIWEVDSLLVDPHCDRLEWTFSVTAEDSTGVSEPLEIHAFVPYGETLVVSAPSSIQTRCDTSPYSVEEMDDDVDLKSLYGVSTFKPSLRRDNCPSPFIGLGAPTDTTTFVGTQCTTEYTTIDRAWNLALNDHGSQLGCIAPSTTTDFPFTQTITLGGLIDDTGLPATPSEFYLQPVQYILPNEREASVATDVSDFWLDGVTPFVDPPAECGLCSNPQDAIVYSHPENFVCQEVGDNQISVTMLNNIGISYTKFSTATVLDTSPPNVFDRTEDLWEDGSLVEDVSKETWDNCEIASYTLTTGPSRGTLDVSQELPMLEYIPDDNYFGPDQMTYISTDWVGNPSEVATLSFDVLPVNDPPLIYEVSHTMNTVQYSDTIVPITILASDVDDTALTISAVYTKNDDGIVLQGLPLGLSFDAGVCTSVAEGAIVTPGQFPGENTAPNAFPLGTECKWVLSGQTRVPEGVYSITMTVTDDGGSTPATLSDSAKFELTVLPENASFAYDATNPFSVKVPVDGGSSGEFSLTFSITETLPDTIVETLPGLPPPSPLAGDLLEEEEGSKVITVELLPIGPGSTMVPVSCNRVLAEKDNNLYATETITCVFDNVPVNTYVLKLRVDGGFYTGSAEDNVFTIYDPSVGFATGGGWFNWPETQEKTNIGFSANYNGNGQGNGQSAKSTPSGSLLIIRHVGDDKSYRVKSTDLEALSVGFVGEGNGFGWAAFSGPCTYRDKDWEEAQEGYEFTVYVEDYNTEDGNGNNGKGNGNNKNNGNNNGGKPPRFWIELRQVTSNATIASLSLPDTAIENAVNLNQGEIEVHN